MSLKDREVVSTSVLCIQKEALLKIRGGSPVVGQAFKALFHFRFLVWFQTSLTGRYLYAVIIVYWCLYSSP